MNYALLDGENSNLRVPNLDLRGINFSFALFLGMEQRWPLTPGSGPCIMLHKDGRVEHMVFAFTSEVSVVWKLGPSDPGIGGDDSGGRNLTEADGWNGNWQHWAGVVKSDGNGGWTRQLFLNGKNFTAAESFSGYVGTGNLTFFDTQSSSLFQHQASDMIM